MLLCKTIREAHDNVCIVCGMSGNSLNFVLTVLWFEHFQILLVPKGRAQLDCMTFDDYDIFILLLILGKILCDLMN